MSPRYSLLTLCLFLLLLSGCGERIEEPQLPQGLTYKPVRYEALPRWEEDDLTKALPALKSSCRIILKKRADSPFKSAPDGSGYVSSWQPFCKEVVTLSADPDSIKSTFETFLKPYRMVYNGSPQAQVTGYYVPVLKGSLKRHGPYQTPLYRMPPEKLRKFSRTAIVSGALRNKNLELVWVKDPIDAFFVQIQGSGKVQLENGRVMHIGYAGQNGHPYHPIGKTLVQKGYLSKGQVSMQSIRAWLKKYPSKAESIMSTNPSYVYFKVRPKTGAVGSQGVPLTPKRSLAVDPKFISLGTPLWISVEHPNPNASKLEHLAVAQDTGGAIKGALRADYFWGEDAENAGPMNSKGELYTFFPKRIVE